MIFISKDVVWSVRVLSVLPGTKGFTVALVHPVSYRSRTNQENLEKIFLSLRHAVDLRMIIFNNRALNMAKHFYCLILVCMKYFS